LQLNKGFYEQQTCKESSSRNCRHQPRCIGNTLGRIRLLSDDRRISGADLSRFLGCLVRPVVKIAKVDVDKSPNLTSRFGIRNIPTLLFFRGGEVKDKVVGLTSKADLISRLKTLS
jgi:thiol-disulfide isomerase/thioredoxin